MTHTIFWVHGAWEIGRGKEEKGCAEAHRKRKEKMISIFFRKNVHGRLEKVGLANFWEGIGRKKMRRGSKR